MGDTPSFQEVLGSDLSLEVGFPDQGFVVCIIVKKIQTSDTLIFRKVGCMEQ
jgi:hypothetical protein